MLSCQTDSGGFGAAPGHDAHLLYTNSAVQILAMVDGLGDLEKRGKEGGVMAVGKCGYSFYKLLEKGTDANQISQNCKIEKRELLPAMNGEKKTHGSLLVHLWDFLC